MAGADTPAPRLIPPELARRMREQIAEAGGIELFFTGICDGDGRLQDATIAARGSRSATPVAGNHLDGADVVIHNHPSGSLDPSDPDIEVAGELSFRGIGSWIVDNGVHRVRVVVEVAPIQDPVPLDPGALADLLGPGGPLETLAPGYEHRAVQQELLAEVARIFTNRGILAAEAGTGVGKSLAYLVPAARFAMDNRRRVVVSTATINLQQQLLQQDIPRTAAILGAELRAVLVKGRSNYLCVNRLDEVRHEQVLFEEDDAELASLLHWAAETTDGSRSELPEGISDSLWQRVNADPDSCSGARCRRRPDCHFLRARQQAAAAHILVVNHHLLFADRAVRMDGPGFESTAVLPPFRHLVVDEAHNLEDSATSFLSERISRGSIARLCSRLLRQRRGRELGLLPTLGASGSLEVGDSRPLIDALVTAAEELNRFSLGIVPVGPGGVRLPVPAPSVIADELVPRLSVLRGALRELGEFLGTVREGMDDAESPGYDELGLVIRRIGRLEAFVGALRNYDDDPDAVYWTRRQESASGAQVEYNRTPLSIGPLVQQSLVEPLDSIVLTSATLATDRGMDHWMKRSGLDPARVIQRQFSSPFDYPGRVLLATVSEGPDPGSRDHSRWLAHAVLSMVEASGGGALVLFTSYAALDGVASAIRDSLEVDGIAVLQQGSRDRAKLLAEFAANRNSVLLGTDSFWEGVDTPGSSLRHVIVTRLPFRVPDDPVFAARSERIDAEGGNAFADLAIPHAITRLRQGFGRLMRRSDDCGVVSVLDTRLHSRSYGSRFLNALPPARLVSGPTENLAEAIREFFASH